MTLWLVRAGRHGEHEDLALEKNVVVVGDSEVRNLAGVGSRDEMLSIYERAHPDAKPRTVLHWASQMWSFKNEIQIGDWVALPLKGRSVVAIGVIATDYAYREDLPPDARHTRSVQWLKEVPRRAIEQDILYSLGAFMTVCRIQRNNAEERIKALVDRKGTPATPASPTPTSDESIAPPDLEQFARDQVRDFISRGFRGHELSRLVASILKAQGYTVQVSPEGPDGGVDIIAGRGPLGFDQPRLAVQVKSGDAPADVKVLRELQGVMKNFGAEQGLFVSLSGFKSSVKKESSRLFFEIRLWDADDIVRMIQAHYDQLSEDIQASLPMKRIWILLESEALVEL